MTTPTYPPQLTGDQVTLLGLGVRAIVAAPVLAWASLTNGYTFVTITSAGATDSRTINAALAASTDRPTFCAALAAELNTAGTTAYTWAVNTSSPVDGLVGTAKAYGSAYNSAPTGTALVGGAGSVTTLGADPYAPQYVIGVDQRILIEAAQDLGGTPDDYFVIYDDFNFRHNSNFNPLTDKIPWSMSVSTPYPWENIPSVVSIPAGTAAGDDIYFNGASKIFASTVMASNICRISTRLKFNASATGYGFLCFDVTGGCMGIGIWGGTHGSLSQFSGMKFTLSFTLGGAQSASEVVSLGARDGAWHTFDIETNGASQIRFRMDAQAWTTWAAYPADFGANPTLQIHRQNAAAMAIDYVIIAVHR